MVSFKRLSKNVIWLIRTLPAFMERFDAIGQENPQAPARIKEMLDVIKIIYSATDTTFNRGERARLIPLVRKHERMLQALIDLDRNANLQEVTDALNSLNDVSLAMMQILNPDYAKS